MKKSVLKWQNENMKELWDIDRNIRYEHETRLVEIRKYVETTKHLSRKTLIKLLNEKPNIIIKPVFVDCLIDNIFNKGE